MYTCNALFFFICFSSVFARSKPQTVSSVVRNCLLVTFGVSGCSCGIGKETRAVYFFDIVIRYFVLRLREEREKNNKALIQSLRKDIIKI